MITLLICHFYFVIVSQGKKFSEEEEFDSAYEYLAKVKSSKMCIPEEESTAASDDDDDDQVCLTYRVFC
jgi:hypothetical protein